MVHQQFINYPYASVFENIASPLRLAKLPKAELERRVEQVASLLRLTPMLGRRPAELSGGQQQRTALARALVKDAQLVLLDEPLANLDYKLREELRTELPRLFENRDCTVVYATSEPLEALLLGGSTATLHEGTVTQFGPTATVYRNPVNLRTAQVFSDPPINMVEISKANGRMSMGMGVAWSADGALTRLQDGKFTAGIRPHFVSPVSTSNRAVRVEGRVLVTELSGSESLVHFDLGGKTWLSHAHGVHLLEIGATAEFFIDTDKVLLFDSSGVLVNPSSAANDGAEANRTLGAVYR
jgi:glycerol transport system ATP-binding protein